MYSLMDKIIYVNTASGSTDYCLNEQRSSLQVQSYMAQLAKVTLLSNNHMH
jgi:hypothetical protein